MNENYKSYLFNLGFAIAVGFVASSLILAWAYTSKNKGDQAITVTGSAKKRIKSDLVVWSTSVAYRSLTLAGAYQNLSANVCQKLRAI